MTTAPVQTPLAVGDKARVTRPIYSAVKVGTVAKVARVKMATPGRDEPLYELEYWPEYYFWRWELAAVGS